MKRIKRFLRDNQWAIVGLLGLMSMVGLFAWLFYAAMEVLGFYVTFALL